MAPTSIPARLSHSVRPLCRHLAWLALLSLHAIGPAPTASAQIINGGFEASPDFTGWTLKWGSYNGGPINFNQTPFPAGHPTPQIVSSAVIGNATLPAMCDQKMARINDMIGGRHATQLSQSVVLRPEDVDGCGVATVQVCWIGAVCDPSNSHPHIAQPAFQFELEHDTMSPDGPVVVDSAFIESEDASLPNSGWTSAGPCAGGTAWYRQYCNPLIVLDAVPGDVLTVRITARDCAWGGHGGMAFLDCVELFPGFPASGSQPGDGCSDDTDLLDLFSYSSLVTPEIWTPAGRCHSNFVAGDFNRDGFDDLVDYGNAACNFQGIRVLQSNGSVFTTIAPGGSTASVPLTWDRVRSGDFNGDGAADLLGFEYSGAQGRVLWGKPGVPPFDGPATVPLSTGTGTDLWIGDYDRDGKDDLARLTPTHIEVALATGNPSAPFFQPFAPWAPQPWPNFTITGGLYAGDFDGDTRCDLMYSDASGVMVFFSTGTGFWPPQNVAPNVSPRPGGWDIGDLDCDNRCDIARWNPTTGRLEMVRIFDVATGGGIGAVSWVAAPLAISFGPVGAPPFVVGDFDGNGRDDFGHKLPQGSVEVLRSWDDCPCLFARAGEPICDPLDGSTFTLPLTITNRTGVPITSVSLTPTSGFTVPATITFPPLLHGKSRTEFVTVTGATDPLETLTVTHVQILPGGGLRFCTDQACFAPVECPCMQAYRSSESFAYCHPDASGDACLDLTVLNISGTQACGVRFTPDPVLSPGVAVTPSTFCFDLPVPGNGGTGAVGNCDVTMTGASPGSYVRIRVELLDCDPSNCDPCACNVICDYTIEFDAPECPTILGECCLTPGGLHRYTQAACLARGGIWAPPGTSIDCDQTWGGSAASRVQVVPTGDGTFLTFTEGGRMFVTNDGTDDSRGFNASFNAAVEMELPLDPIERSDSGALSGITLDAVGSVHGTPALAVAALEVAMNDDETYDVDVNFEAVMAANVHVIVRGEDSFEPVVIPGSLAGAVVSASPAEVVLGLGDEGRPVYVLRFAETTAIQIDGEPLLHGDELEFAGEAEPFAVDFFTSVEFKSRWVGGSSSAPGACGPTYATGIIHIESTPCQGDLTGDCIVDQADVDLMTAALGTDLTEFDLNGDAVVDVSDLFVVQANFGIVCPCADGAPLPDPADWNGDGVVNSTDLFDFLVAFDSGDADFNSDGITNSADLFEFFNVFFG